MKKISQTTQVMTITHLPTVAAKADHHYKVLKFDDGNETYTELKHLRYEEKIEELASMISGEEITEESIEYAKTLLS
jgi:DNA repair protein RecN (Recombination protein N)